MLKFVKIFVILMKFGEERLWLVAPNRFLTEDCRVNIGTTTWPSFSVSAIIWSDTYPNIVELLSIVADDTRTCALGGRVSIVNIEKGSSKGGQLGNKLKFNGVIMASRTTWPVVLRLSRKHDIDLNNYRDIYIEIGNQTDQYFEICENTVYTTIYLKFAVVKIADLNLRGTITHTKKTVTLETKKITWINFIVLKLNQN